MELGRGILSPTPSLLPPPSSRPHSRTTPSSAPPAVPWTHDPVSWQVASASRHPPATSLKQEQYEKPGITAGGREEDQTILYRGKRDYIFPSYKESQENEDIKDLRCQSPFWHTSLPSEVPLSYHMEYSGNDTAIDVKSSGEENSISCISPFSALKFANMTMLASQEAIHLAGIHSSLGSDLDKIRIPRGKEMVRSGQWLERQFKKHRLSKKKYSSLNILHNSATDGFSKKTSKSFESKESTSFLARHPKAKKLLTLKEERELLTQIQEHMEIEKIKHKLHTELTREPTLPEWAEAVGMSCHSLQQCVSNGIQSRDKMINSNLRLVTHVAKYYQGKGVDLEELVQAGILGLRRSLEKFDLRIGRKFSTYAYWWIRQAVSKTLFDYSRTTRLPANVYHHLRKIRAETNACILEGYFPTDRDLAKRVGITVKRLKLVLSATSKKTISLDTLVWGDYKTTLQDITADPQTNTPEHETINKMMRQDLQNFLEILPPREKQIICLRFGIFGNEKKTLDEIGKIYGISSERVRQLEGRALDKLRRCPERQGLRAYIPLIIEMKHSDSTFY